MPLYEYECLACFKRYDARRPIDGRHKAWCPDCGEVSGRVFTPTRNIFVDENFRHLQSDFLPEREDKKAWENVGSKEWDSQRHDAPQPDLKGYLKSELLYPKREKVTLASS